MIFTLNFQVISRIENISAISLFVICLGFDYLGVLAEYFPWFYAFLFRDGSHLSASQFHSPHSSQKDSCSEEDPL